MSTGNVVKHIGSVLLYIQTYFSVHCSYSILGVFQHEEHEVLLAWTSLSVLDLFATSHFCAKAILTFCCSIDLLKIKTWHIDILIFWATHCENIYIKFCSLRSHECAWETENQKSYFNCFFFRKTKQFCGIKAEVELNYILVFFFSLFSLSFAPIGQWASLGGATGFIWISSIQSTDGNMSYNHHSARYDPG